MTLKELREQLDGLEQMGILGDVPVTVCLSRLDGDTYGGEWFDHLNEVNLSIMDGELVLELRSIPEWEP